MRAKLQQILGLWSAMRKTAGRQRGNVLATAQNNFFFFVAVMIYGNVSLGLEPQSAYFFLVLLGVLLLLPSAGDPVDRLPAERLVLWPVEGWQLGCLRVAGLLLRPGFWVFLVVLWRSSSAWAAIGFLCIGLLLQMGTFGLRRWGAGEAWMRWVPGIFGELILKNMRELLTQLDFYLALILAAGALCVWLLGGSNDAALGPVFGLMVALALSTPTQGGFAMEGEAGTARYRIWPVPGWVLWGAKDLAFLLVLAVLTLPLGAGPALAMGLCVLAMRHLIGKPMEQKAWRFSGGALWPVGLAQVLGGLGAGVWEYRWGYPVLLLLALFYLGTLAYAGWRWELSRLPGPWP